MRSLEFASLHLERGEPTPRPARRGEERPLRWVERPKSTSHAPRVQIEAARDAVAHVRRLLLLDDRSYVHLKLADVCLVAVFDERDVQQQVAVPVLRVIKLVLSELSIGTARGDDAPSSCTSTKTLVTVSPHASSISKSVFAMPVRCASWPCAIRSFFGTRAFHVFVNHHGFSSSHRALRAA